MNDREEELLGTNGRNQNRGNAAGAGNRGGTSSYNRNNFQEYGFREYEMNNQRSFDQINQQDQSRRSLNADENQLAPDQIRNLQLNKALNQVFMEMVIILLTLIVIAIWLISNSKEQCNQEIKTWIGVFMGEYIVDFNLLMAQYHLMKKNRKDSIVIIGLRFILLVFLVSWLIYGHVLYYKFDLAQDCNSGTRVLMFLMLVFGYYEMMKCCCYGTLFLILIPLIFFASRRAQRPNWMPAAPQFVQNLYQTRFNPSSNNDSEVVCSICLLEFQENDEVIPLPCNEKHIYHPDCIKQWLHNNNSCPLCKTPITQQALEEQQRRVHRRSSVANRNQRR